MSFQLCTTKEFLWALGMGTSLVLGLRKNGFSSLRKVTSCGQNMMSFHAINLPAPIFKLFFIRSSQAVNSNWIRSIEWSLRAFASMRIVCLFLRAREVVKFFLASRKHFRHIQMASSEHFRHIQMACSEHFSHIQMASSKHFRNIQMASSEHFKYFVNFPLAETFLLLIG